MLHSRLAILPAKERALHISIKVMFDVLDQCTIVGIIVPLVRVISVSVLRAANNNRPVVARDLIDEGSWSMADCVSLG